jgi:hypothetical protein
MQPKLIAVSIAAVLAATSAPLCAGPLGAVGGSEVKALAYVSLPFGGVSRRQEAPILGFAIDHKQPQGPRDGFSVSPLQSFAPGNIRSLVDIRFNTQTQNWQRFRIGGVDALAYTTRMRADGTTETVGTLAEIPTWAIVTGVVVGAAVIHDVTKKDDSKTTTPICPPGTVWTGLACV